MPSVLDEIREVFGEENFYAILNIAKTASKNEIRKAYYQLSLQVHPDRAEKSDLDIATKKFQALSKIYEILSNDGKRALYDETGTVDDECDISHDERDWYEYWRLLFARVSEADIEEFEKKYKGSDEEKEDLKKAYLDAKGDMDQIIDNVLCATVEDEARFRTIIEGWINDKTVKPFAAFTRENKKKREERKRKATAEALEAEQELKNLTKSKNTSLVAMIQQNQKSRSDRADDFFAELEKKYGGGASSRTTSPSRKKRKTSHGDTSAQSPGRRSRDGSPQKQKQQQSVQSRSPRSASSPAKKQAKKQNKNNKAAAPSKPSKDSKKKTAAKTTAKRPKK